MQERDLVEGDKSEDAVTSDELAHLKAMLQLYDNCIPVIHHHFVPLQSSIDKYILENSHELIKVLGDHKHKIMFCITGHVHGHYVTYANMVKVYSSFSTCIQFAQTSSLLFDRIKPGYTIYQFHGGSYEVYSKTI